ncbi:DUF6522 family protein [Roseovarius sp. CAU 1744]|uniref:DUF6522 family protein n=1 Tax=Roseovarius sp. CAU 1744 TaxID=3140368 RepID=UPI00325B3008
MKLEVTDGGVTVDARDLAPLIGCRPADVPGLMREGKITSVFERGEGADAGRFRVSFRFGATKVRFTCAEDGTVLSQIRTTVPDAG